MANKLYNESSVRAIANALRLKNDASSDVYKIAEMENGVLSLPFSNIPSYHYAEAGRVIKRILELKSTYPNHICFGTISDNHVDIANANSLTSVRHASFALEAVGAMSGCDFVANLGDNIHGNAGVDDDESYSEALYMENSSRYALTSQVGFSLVGNHDKSSSTQRLYDLMGKLNDFDNYGTTKIRGYGYKDFTEKKVRVICLNTTDYWNVIGGNGMSYEQKDFFMKALDLSTKTDYADWTIVVLSHIPLDFLGGDYNKGSDLKAILKAYNDGTTATITVNSTYAGYQNESNVYSGTLTYNYSGKNAPRVINVHGHIHTNKYGKLKFIDDNTELDMVRIATPNSSFSGNAGTDRYTSYGDYSITTTEAAKIAKAANSKRDTSATFYFIDLDKQVIHSIGYGADIDREVVYSTAQTYTVTLNLTNVTASNTANRVFASDIYSNILTADEDCTLDTVVVTMGGVDITSSVYGGNGVIKIAQVVDGVNNIIITGDIVITAVAKATPFSYTVPDINVAIRQDFTDSLLFGNTNSDAIVSVSTPNDYSYTSRENNNELVYLMPVPTKANTIIVEFAPEVETVIRYVGLKVVDGTLTEVFRTARNAYSNPSTYTFTKGSIDYIVPVMRRVDLTGWAWGFDDSLVSVTFTNGVSGSDSGGDNEQTTHSVTYNLTNVTVSNNSITSVVEGDSYQTSVSAKTDYTIDTVTVTMGGVDITSTAYMNGVITIVDVTGNIVITASATTTQTSYTNLFKSTDADFQNGYILRSSGTTKSGAGFTSGYIAVELDDDVRVRCPSGTSYNSHGTGAPIIYLYDANKTAITGFYSTQPEYVPIDDDGLGFSCHIGRSNCAFVRVSGYPAGAYSDFVVTKNEEIK